MHQKCGNLTRATLTPGGWAWWEWEWLMVWRGVSGAEGSSGQQISWQASFLPIMLITSHSVCEQSLICKRQTFTLRYLWAWCSVGARRQSGHRGRSLCGQRERYNNSLIPAWVLFYYYYFFCLFVFGFVAEVQTYCILLRTAGYLQFSRPDPLYGPNSSVTHNSYR